MAKKRKVGRPLMKDSEKLVLVSAYLNKNDKKGILKKYGSLSKAVRERILPELS